MPQPPLKNEWVPVGGRLREAREYLGLSQRFAAEQIGVSQPALTLMEQGRREVSAIEMQSLSRLYRRPVQFFTTGEYPAELRPTIPADLNDKLAELSDRDRNEVLRFMEFLAGAGTAPRVTRA